jgi:type VI secretion system protein ImpK
MRMSDCFMEIIAYAAFVARCEKTGQQPFELVKATMQRLIAQGEDQVQKLPFSHEDYQLARFAVFAWVDETFMSSAWEGRGQWQREQLQRQYYQTADAGELFFERLNVLGPHQRDVREVYYLCLALGFTGQYCNPGDDFMLDQLRVSNLKLLTGSSAGLPAMDKQELFPEAYPQQTENVPGLSRPGRFSRFTLACAAAPVALYGLLYLIYAFILSNIGEKLIGTVP